MTEHNPYASPQTDLPPVPVRGISGALVRDGDVLLAPPLTLLEPVCVKCGARHDLIGRTQQFSWHPRWVYWLLLLRFFPYIIGALLTRKKSTLTYSLCPDHAAAMKRARWMTAGIVVGALVAIFGSVAFATRSDNMAVALGLIIAAMGGMIWASRTLIRPHLLYVRKITKERAEYVGVAAEALDVLVPNGFRAE